MPEKVSFSLPGRNETIFFKSFEFKDGLPFPLYLSLELKLSLAVILFIALIFGIRLRGFIFKYLRSPDTKGPVNYLIWVDQVNGFLLGVVIVLKIVLTVSPIPLSLIFNETFCEWIDLPGCMYIVGATVWTSFIAFFRIIFIKAQNWLKFRVGEKRLLRLLLGLGTFFHVGGGLLFAALDDNSVVGKMCLHYSTQEMEILHNHQVISPCLSSSKIWEVGGGSERITLW